MQDFFSEQTQIFLIYCGVAVGVLVAFTSLTAFLSRRETTEEVRSRRLRMIREGRSIEERLALLKPPSADEVGGRIPILGKLAVLLRRADLSLSVSSFLALCLVLALGSFLPMLLTPVPVPAAAALALVLGFGVPVSILRLRVERKKQALIMQLSDALELMARGLRVGHPLDISIGTVAQEMPDPIGSEFGIIFDQVNYGDTLPDAFQDFAERVDIEDVYYLSASIGIQHGTGSDLAHVVELLSKVVRSRIMMRRKVRAISAEGRASAAFLSVLPILMFVFTSISSPNYYAGVYDDPLFAPMATAIIVLTIANALILRKLVNFHV
ncbi:type II secretion system F family protein [Tabrizicola caldifontis]|uniref:type II secretion system F family protein n=1 Tax=Tabrizicola caldifontis TaxID=2528036 RepID=UPI0010815730|nr:type II secretion system F family protein [Rhodobacter sp. YIM 73028]